MVLRRIGPLSLARISATIYALMGLILGACFSLVSVLVAAFRPEQAGGPFGVLFGVGAVIWLPLLYGGMGFLGALIMAGLYNWLAGWVGGVTVELQQAAPPAHGATS